MGLCVPNEWVSIDQCFYFIFFIWVQAIQDTKPCLATEPLNLVLVRSFGLLLLLLFG